MTGAQQQKGNNSNGEGQKPAGIRDLIGATKGELNRGRLGWEIAEAESQRGHEHHNHSRRAAIIKATNEGKFDLPRISVEQAHRLSRLTVPIILATVVLLGACWGMGVFQWFGEVLKPDPTPMIVLMPDSQNPGAYVTALYMPPTSTPEPTQFSTSTSAPTQMIPSQVETQVAPVVQDPTPFPTVASNQYYSAWVKQGNTYQPGYWNFNTQEGMDLIAGKTESHACGEWVSFGQADVIAIVNTNESAPSATIEVAEDGNSVRVNCTYTTPVQYYAP